MKRRIETVEREGKVFPYVSVGAEEHYRPSYRLWVSSILVQRDDRGEYVEFPINGVIRKTERGTLVLKPGEGWTYDVFFESGYRGESQIEFLDPVDTNAIHPYAIYASPRGNLGISRGALVSLPLGHQPIRVMLTRSGRLYGEPDELLLILKDGKIEQCTAPEVLDPELKL